MKTPLLIVTGSAALLVGCGAPTSYAESDVEETTKEELSAEKVDCPDDLVGEVGRTMECTATVDGKEVDIRLTVTKADDDTIEWDVELID